MLSLTSTSGSVLEPVKRLYTGVLRLLLVICHDFPEFLVEYHLTLTDAIPKTCMQMRNLVLSAFPRHMRLPDPFTSRLKIDMLPDVLVIPKTSCDILPLLSERGLRQKLDEFLTTHGPVTFLQQLPSYLTTSANPLTTIAAATAITTGTTTSTATTPAAGGAGASSLTAGNAAGSIYNHTLISALVYYLGHWGATHPPTAQQLAAAAAAANKSTTTTNGVDNNGSDDADAAAAARLMLTSPAVEVINSLLVMLDPEGRHLVLSSMANNLRFPNAHTLWHSRALLYIFTVCSDYRIKEQVTRVLLERLIVHKPQPVRCDKETPGI